MHLWEQLKEAAEKKYRSVDDYVAEAGIQDPYKKPPGFVERFKENPVETGLGTAWNTFLYGTMLPKWWSPSAPGWKTPAKPLEGFLAPTKKGLAGAAKTVPSAYTGVSQGSGKLAPWAVRSDLGPLAGGLTAIAHQYNKVTKDAPRTHEIFKKDHPIWSPKRWAQPYSEWLFKNSPDVGWADALAGRGEAEQRSAKLDVLLRNTQERRKKIKEVNENIAARKASEAEVLKDVDATRKMVKDVQDQLDAGVPPQQIKTPLRRPPAPAPPTAPGDPATPPPAKPQTSMWDEMGQYVPGASGGAALGAVFGALSRSNRLQNTLLGILLGGLTGVGAQYLFEQYNKGKQK
jgi:hypothetical protein